MADNDLKQKINDLDKKMEEMTSILDKMSEHLLNIENSFASIRYKERKYYNSMMGNDPLDECPLD